MIYLSAGIFVGLYSILLIIVIYMCVKYSREKPKEWENVNAFVRNLEQQRERQATTNEGRLNEVRNSLDRRRSTAKSIDNVNTSGRFNLEEESKNNDKSKETPSGRKITQA